ncbi:MAG: glycosyltransferase, partial [Ignavibacteria bacterium]|nr:glycosyltransferase [Ignavibacteria bacterium]
MKILIVCSGNVEDFNLILHHAFIYEQIESIKHSFNIEYDVFYIKGKGITGYLSNLRKFNNKIKSFNPDVVHAHFGLSGLLACLQRKSPVVITFHGSDVNQKKIRPLSRLAARLSDYSIFVSDKILKKIKVKTRASVIPCGINIDVFYPVEKKIAREKLNMVLEKKFILFSGNFEREVKNSSLAFSAMGRLKMDCELIELKSKTRQEVNLLLNACNLLLLTSISEGSPQVIKEAMACNCPIVATDVGDIREVIGDTEGCYLTSFDPDDIAQKITLA